MRHLLTFMNTVALAVKCGPAPRLRWVFFVFPGNIVSLKLEALFLIPRLTLLCLRRALEVILEEFFLFILCEPLSLITISTYSLDFLCSALIGLFFCFFVTPGERPIGLPVLRCPSFGSDYSPPFL